ncbi:Hypothetical protein D9617_1g085130 [Elsinoe fawcettii]|nr:Hypothetical protein D9617_1g085130 [Elsinoe fawcettii]
MRCTWEAKVQSPPKLTKDDHAAQLALVQRQPMLTKSFANSGYLPFQSQAQFDLVIKSPQYLGLLISRSASPTFHKTSVLISIAVQNDWIRDALAAFAAYNIAAPEESGPLSQMGLQMYQSALSNLRRHISLSGGESIEVLTNVTFLGIFESLGTGNAQMAVKHFGTAARLSRTIPLPRDDTQLMLYRIAVECWLFNLATLSIYIPVPDTLLSTVDWTVLDKTFGNLFSYELTLPASPFIGGSHAIYRLMLQVTCYVRRPIPQNKRSLQATKWSTELERLTDGLSSYYRFLADDVASLYYWKHMLHVLAIRIFLVKIADRQCKSSSPEISSIVENAQNILIHSTTHEARNPSMAWPLVVFLCASHHMPTFDFFVSIVTTIRDNFDPGHRKRFSEVLKTLRSFHGDNVLTRDNMESTNFDTLDLLLLEDGILSVSSQDCGTPFEYVDRDTLDHQVHVVI